MHWTFYECQNPAVAADIPGYLVVYEELPPPGSLADSTNLTSYQHIYGRMWWPEAAYLPLTLKNHFLQQCGRGKHGRRVLGDWGVWQL